VILIINAPDLKLFVKIVPSYAMSVHVLIERKKFGLIRSSSLNFVSTCAIIHNCAPILGSGMHALNHVMNAVRIRKDTFRSIQTKVLPATHLKVLQTKKFARGKGSKIHVHKRVMFAR